MNFLKRLAAASLLSAMPFMAYAATFDFAQIANDFKYSVANTQQREGTYEQIKDGLGAGVFTDGGISITNIIAGGTNIAGTPAHAFFDGSATESDALSGLDLAGLGVCSNGFSTTETVWTGTAMSQCSSNGGSATGDDNISGSEFVVLAFDQLVNIFASTWRDASHNLFSGSLFYASDSDGSIGGEPLGTLTIVDGIITNVGAGSNGLEGINVFGFLLTGSSSPDSEIYLSSLSVTAAVPLPAGIVLLGTALAGFGFARSRKVKRN